MTAVERIHVEGFDLGHLGAAFALSPEPPTASAVHGFLRLAEAMDRAMLMVDAVDDEDALVELWLTAHAAGRQAWQLRAKVSWCLLERIPKGTGGRGHKDAAGVGRVAQEERLAARLRVAPITLRVDRQIWQTFFANYVPKEHSLAERTFYRVALGAPEPRVALALFAERHAEDPSYGPEQARRDLKLAEREERRAVARRTAPADPEAPRIALASWEDWLPEQEPCDLLLTDPPYSTDVEDIAAFAWSWMPLALSRVKPTGHAYVCVGAYPDELVAYLTAPCAGMTLANILVWTYRNTLGPVPKRGYKLNWQAVLYFHGPEAPSLTFPDMLEQFSVQDINAPDGRFGERYHTWQKPEELARRLIAHSTEPGQTVLDPFAGTGTFVLVAHRMGRVARGCDVSEAMLGIAEIRGCRRA
jgi:hypothetical protein